MGKFVARYIEKCINSIAFEFFNLNKKMQTAICRMHICFNWAVQTEKYTAFQAGPQSLFTIFICDVFELNHTKKLPDEP